MTERAVCVAAASRPVPGETANGDDWVSWESAGGLRVAVIDGLGHGRLAAAAAAELRRLFLEHADCPIERAIEVAGRRMEGGRGAVGALVEVREDELTFIGVGNVEGRLEQDGEERRLMGGRGFFGAPLPRLRPLRRQLHPGWALYLYTDGVSSRLRLPADGGERDAQIVVDEILERYARETDDATVVLLREARPLA